MVGRFTLEEITFSACFEHASRMNFSYFKILNKKETSMDELEKKKSEFEMEGFDVVVKEPPCWDNDLDIYIIWENATFGFAEKCKEKANEQKDLFYQFFQDFIPVLDRQSFEQAKEQNRRLILQFPKLEDIPTDANFLEDMKTKYLQNIDPSEYTYEFRSSSMVVFPC